METILIVELYIWYFPSANSLIDHVESLLA
jgi:hypothetical protein